MNFCKLQIPGSLALTALLGCSTGGALIVDIAAPHAAIAQDVDEGYFYSNLAPHGEWFFQAEFGWVWHPAHVGPGWRPYTEGQWVWADDVGWTWASEEPWGWATYHYGRWYFDPYYGWSWVPGRTWAPAWVSWRIESGYIGWAPLWPVYFDIHPEYRWDGWHHDRDWDNRHRGRDWDRWVFTRDRDFTSDRVGRRQITDRRERDRIYSHSRDVTQYDESHPERIGHSIDRRTVEQATGRPVRPVKIETSDSPHKRDDTRSDRIAMFRPQVRETPDKTPNRLGLAKEPTPEARKRDTIREEKTRLDRVPDSQKKPGRNVDDGAAPDKGDRGGAAATEEREPRVDSGADRHSGRPHDGAPNQHGRPGPGANTEPAQPASRVEPQDAQPQPPHAKQQHMRPNSAEQAQPERMHPGQPQQDQPEPMHEREPRQAPPEHMRPDHVQPQQQYQQQEPRTQQMQQERMQSHQHPQAERPEHRESMPQQEAAPQAQQHERAPVEHRGNPSPPAQDPQGGAAKPHHGPGGQPPATSADDPNQPPPHGSH